MQHEIWSKMVAARSTKSFQDMDFVAGPRSVDGRQEQKTSTGDFFKATMSEVTRKMPEVNEAEVLCHCGLVAQLRRVQKRGPTYGRPYHACPSRQCRFFEFADQGSTLAALELKWKRFPAINGWSVVGDEGFLPADVRQGGARASTNLDQLGDLRWPCFRKLLPNLNEGAESGCHEVRLFLDGHWTAVLVDDWLPTTEKQRRPDGTGLAYARCTGQQLWAYAKAHGAYRFISGGETSEALLELTGAPTEVVNFQGPSFDPDLFWARLVSLLQAGCPIGCGTSAMTLEELGLVGQHAYSVLEAEDGGGFCFSGDGRRVKVRNPWGEWTRREQDELLAQLGVAITPGDGCFWMNYSDFIRGFACADICYARAGWHSQSFDLEFDGSEGLGVRSAMRLRGLHGAVECWVMGIQPTERGKQIKRPKGYYLNDLSLLILDDAGEVVASVLGGARRDVSCSFVMEAAKEYLAVPVSFRASRGPFVLRIYAAAPVQVIHEPAKPELAWTAMHRLLMSPAPKTQMPFQRMAYDFGVGEVVVIESASMALGLAVNQDPSASLQVRFLAAGNHTVLRTQGGIQEGCPDEDRNQRQRQTESKGKGRGKGHGQKPNWHLYDLEVSVPKFSQSLAFVAVAKLDSWEFSLEKMEAKQDLGQAPVVPATSAFAPVTPSHWVNESLPVADEDAELQAAILASQHELACSSRILKGAQLVGPQWAVKDAEVAESDDELALAISLSLQPLAPKEALASNRWARRCRQPDR
eukprot:Skav214253  [mRNA]  locus=scaffold2045:400783:407890:- [translate_table: standard]